MDITAIIDSIVSLSRQHPLIAAGAALALIYLAGRSTRFVLGVIALLAVLAVIWYLIIDLGAAGKASKKRVFEKTDRQVEQVR